MKFTSEDLMKAMGLNVGDKVKVTYVDNNFTATDEIYEIKQGAGDTYIQSIDEGFIDSLAYLIDQDFEILPRPKRVGDLKCDDFECDNCPLKYLCCLKDWGFKTTNNLFHILNVFDCADTEIHDLLKARLDVIIDE